jgi:hypothetical protein
MTVGSGALVRDTMVPNLLDCGVVIQLKVLTKYRVRERGVRGCHCTVGMKKGTDFEG